MADMGTQRLDAQEQSGMAGLSFLSSELSMRQGGPGNAWQSQEDAPECKPLAIRVGSLTSAISEPRGICVLQLRKRRPEMSPNYRGSSEADTGSRLPNLPDLRTLPYVPLPRARGPGNAGKRLTGQRKAGRLRRRPEAGETRAADCRGEAGRGSKHQGAQRGAGLRAAGLGGTPLLQSTGPLSFGHFPA